MTKIKKMLDKSKTALDRDYEKYAKTIEKELKAAKKAALGRI